MGKRLVLNSRNCRKLVYLQIILVMTSFFLNSELHFPSMITYLTDVVTVLLFLYMILNRQHTLQRINAKYIQSFFLGYVFVSLLSSLINFVKPQLVIWGARNVFRGYVFWMACIRFLEIRDIKKLFNGFFVVQIVNLFISLFQYFYLGYSQDNLGGIFGSASGANAYTNVFFIIIFTYYCSAFIAKKEPLWKFATVALTTMLVAALAELKIYYFEFVAIILLCVSFSKPSRKTLGIVLISVIAMIVGLNILKEVFPLQYRYLTDFESILQYSFMESGGYNISRVSAFPTITDIFFNGNILFQLIGMGMGSSEMSAYSFLVSDFFLKHGHYNYRWFSHMMFYIETGYIGFALFVLFFVGIFIYATRNRQALRRIEGSVHIAVFTQVITIMTMVNLWYNQAIRSEAQYLVYFSLSVCFVYMRNDDVVAMNSK